MTDALTEMGKLLQSDKIAGGTSNALQTDFPTSVTQVFADPPKAAQVLEGDFVGTNIATETKAQPQTDYNVYAFPEINDSGPMVMGGGDVMVMFKDNPASRALIEYLATPEAAEIWVKKGGFSSPNKNVDTSLYPDEFLKKTATDLANAEVVPLRHVRPDAGSLRQRRPLHAAAGLPQEPGRRRGDPDEARDRGQVGIQVVLGRAEATT